MKRSAILVCLSLVAVFGGARAEPPANSPEQQLVLAIKELEEQQAQIAENQAKIEVKLVTVAEALRIARIYASRGGH